MSAEIHNQLTKELLTKLVTTVQEEAAAYVVMESLLLGVMYLYRPDIGEASEFLDSMTARVIERMKAQEPLR